MKSILFLSMLYLSVMCNASIPEGTKILLSRPLHDEPLNVENLATLSPKNKSVATLSDTYEAKVEYVLISESNDLYHLKLEDNKGHSSTLTVSENTLIYDFEQDRYVDVRDIKLFTKLYGINKDNVYANFTVQTKTFVKEREAFNVYDLELEDPHIFFIADSENNFILIHNAIAAIRAGASICGEIAAAVGAGIMLDREQRASQTRTLSVPPKMDLRKSDTTGKVANAAKNAIDSLR